MAGLKACTALFTTWMVFGWTSVQGVELSAPIASTSAAMGAGSSNMQMMMMSLARVDSLLAKMDVLDLQVVSLEGVSPRKTKRFLLFSAVV